MRKAKIIMKLTDSNKVYRLARKAYLANTMQIRCQFCPYHSKENSVKRPNNNWKKHRKTKWKIDVTAS